MGRVVLITIFNVVATFVICQEIREKVFLNIEGTYSLRYYETSYLEFLNVQKADSVDEYIVPIFSGQNRSIPFNWHLTNCKFIYTNIYPKGKVWSIKIDDISLSEFTSDNFAGSNWTKILRYVNPGTDGFVGWVRPFQTTYQEAKNQGLSIDITKQKNLYFVLVSFDSPKIKEYCIYQSTNSTDFTLCGCKESELNTPLNILNWQNNLILVDGDFNSYKINLDNVDSLLKLDGNEFRQLDELINPKSNSKYYEIYKNENVILIPFN